MAWVLREGLRIPGLAAISARLPQPVRDPRVFILFVTSVGQHFSVGPVHVAFSYPPDEE